MEKTYRDALSVALANSGGADASELASWAEQLRRANADLDGAIAAAVRAGDLAGAQEISDRGEGIEACASFLDKFYAELADPRPD